MKLIDKMLKYARDITTSMLYQYGTDGLFIEAIGLDPEKYVVNYPNGDYGYDDIAALQDSVATIWND